LIRWFPFYFGEFSGGLDRFIGAFVLTDKSHQRINCNLDLISINKGMRHALVVRQEVVEQLALYRIARIMAISVDYDHFTLIHIDQEALDSALIP
jgi:hypothetical protein